MPVLPGHNYIGPGNSLDNGEPIDRDDRIAFDHDLSYTNARSESDIRAADRRAIHQFGSDFLFNQNYHSAIGALGLGAKYGLESITGVLYPKMPHGKRKASDQGESLAAESSVDSTMQADQAGQSLPGGTGSDVMATIVHNPSSKPTTVTFRKNFQIYTGGFQFDGFPVQDFKIGSQTLDKFVRPNDLIVLCTPLAALSPDCLGLFLSRAQFNELPAWSYAKSCTIKVTPLGYRLPFQTNEAQASFANSQTLVQICYGTGLNRMLTTVEGGYTTNSTDLTQVESINDSFDWESALYGSGNILGCNIGIPRHWNNYTSFIYPAPSQTNGTPNLIDMICIQNVNDCKGTPIINYKYDYKNGILKTGYGQHQEIKLDGNPYATLSGENKDPRRFDRSGSDFLSNQLDPQLTYPINSNNDTVINNYVNRVEKAHWIQRNIYNHQSTDTPPMVHFGCMPVQSNAVLANDTTFANAVIQWQIETTMNIEYHYNYVTPQLNLAYNRSWDPIITNVDTTDNSRNVERFYGYAHVELMDKYVSLTKPRQQ